MLLTYAVLVFIHLGEVLSFDSRNVVFVIVGSTDAYHVNKSSQLKHSITSQLQQLENLTAKVHLSHEDLRTLGDWTILPLFRPLITKYRDSKVRWIVFLEPRTVVRCEKLMQVLSNADKNQNTMWIGHLLKPSGPISHTESELGGIPFPHLGSGFAIRKQLMRKVKGTSAVMISVSPGFDLAAMIFGASEPHGPVLTAEPSFCIEPGEHCATYQAQFTGCGSPVAENEIFFAIKTWSGFHDTRAVVVKKTWSQYVTNVAFFSDKADPSLPTISVGLVNRPVHGDCAKTMEILKKSVNLVQNKPHIKWIFLVDDDTIFGVQRLCEILSCFKGGFTITMLGERFGYGYTNIMNGALGFDFITGGAGTILSVGAAVTLSSCPCSFPKTGDDMNLGFCATTRNITQIHLPLFHQFQPEYYHKEVLSRDRPVSFHGHSSPEHLYATWFLHDDRALKIGRKDEL